MQLQVVAVSLAHAAYPPRPSDAPGRPVMSLPMKVEFFTRPGCHLCDEARTVLLRELERTPFELDEIDIETDSWLVREYGLRIPVVVIGGEEAFEYSVDPAELAARLRP
ncbi:MAG TPA: glutaredoxin family protein [Actinomycetota bacterium]|nr:glutaredoxin family protein [Actinomycetota bacterium]